MSKNINEFVVDKVCHYIEQQNEEMHQLRKKLKKTEDLLEAYIDATNLSAYPIGHTKCNENNCEALYVSDNRDSDIYLGCNKMKYCNKCNNMFCDLHHYDHTTTCVCEYEWEHCCGCFDE